MHIVLIPGAWLGPWIWESVADGLRRAGHGAYPVTLPGLLGSEDVSDIGLAAHVDAVLATIADRELRDVIVVGHSYSGIVAGQVADRLPDRVARTVYVESFLPHDGQPMLAGFGPDGAEAERAAIARNGGRWPAPTEEDLTYQEGLTDQQRALLLARFVGQPGRTVSEPVTLTRPLGEQPATYVVSTVGGHWVSPDVAAMRAEPSWSFETLESSHWPMVSAPDRLTALLDRIASEHERAGAGA